MQRRALPIILVSMSLGAATIPDLAELSRMAGRFTPVKLATDPSSLSPGDRQALARIVEAARVIDDVFLSQVWDRNQALRNDLLEDTSPLGKARLRYFDLNKGPWSDLDDHSAFLPGVPERKPPGSNFYPQDLSRQEFETWVSSLPQAQADQARGFFSVIRRDSGRSLRIVPYSVEYRDKLTRAANLLQEAAGFTTNESLRTYLDLRAKAFLSDDYYASDVAWMRLDSPIDVTIGPYETYMDELFGYKAAFEAYVTLRDDEETAKLQMFAAHLQEVENNLPLDAAYRNPKLGELAPIRVVNQVLSSGDGAHGVRTAAFNLPNDERIIRAMGSKRVMLKNVQEAKFSTILTPIARIVLSPADQRHLSFNAFFTHIVAHEMSHGIGPQENVRQSLKELHSAIEEAKADATGLFMLQYLFDRKLLPAGEEALYSTFLASAFRTLRFGIHEAHGKGMALQFNYLVAKGAFLVQPDGTFAVEASRMKGAVRDLVHDLLAIEAAGDYDGARKMLDQLAVLTPPIERALARLTNIPTDILPE